MIGEGKVVLYSVSVLTQKYVRSMQVNTGSGMNNAISLSSYGDNESRVTVCNNDHTVKIYSLPNLQRLTTLNMPSPINHGKREKTLMSNAHPFLMYKIASTSPDGRKMVCVSDSGDVYFYDIRASDYRQVAAMKGKRQGWKIAEV